MICENLNLKNVFFVIFNKSSEGTSKLKQDFEQNYKNHVESKLHTFTRSESLQYFAVQDDKDDLKVIQNILLKLPPSSVILFDETPIVRGRDKSSDWSGLQNTRSNENISMIVSFQPLQESTTRNVKPVKLKLPSNAVKIELTRAYRTSSSIYHSLQEIKYLNVKPLNTEAQPVETVVGGQPIHLQYNMADVDDFKVWILCNLLKFRCESQQIQVLYTDNTERDAKRLFESTEFSSCLLHWRHFVGCEAPIVVCLFSPQKDESWQLMTMASRAQQQVFYSIYVLMYSH